MSPPLMHLPLTLLVCNPLHHRLSFLSEIERPRLPFFLLNSYSTYVGLVFVVTWLSILFERCFETTQSLQCFRNIHWFIKVSSNGLKKGCISHLGPEIDERFHCLNGRQVRDKRAVPHITPALSCNFVEKKKNLNLGRIRTCSDDSSTYHRMTH